MSALPSGRTLGLCASGAPVRHRNSRIQPDVAGSDLALQAVFRSAMRCGFSLRALCL
jgi:hypothetical protein